MATQQTRPLEWTVCLGRNGWDSPLSIPEDMAAEVVNWTFTGALGKKRDGCASVTLTGDAYARASALGCFIPGQDETKAELFIVSEDPKILRVPVSSAIALTLIDAVAATQEISMVQHNGKFFIAYDSDVNRLHVYDPATSTSVIRRAGLALPGAATVADTGVGFYAATIRYYRIQYRVISGSTIVRQSNIGPSVSFTPSGAGTAARITKPAATGEGETHWVVHGSADDTVYYELASVVVGTATYDDSVNPSAYSLGLLSSLVGANTPFPSVKYIASDGLHLFGFGVWETAAGDAMTPVPGRVYFSPALGSSDTGDDERVSNTLTQRGWIECNPNGGGIDRGLSGPLNNRMYVFQSKGIYMLVPTGDPVSPFARVVLTTAYGSVSNLSQVMAEDEFGQPALYFLDPNDGPRRISTGRTIQWMGKDVYDTWRTVNLNATNVLPFGVYYAQRKQVIWWITTGGATFGPNLMITLDVSRGRVEAEAVRYGWSIWAGDMCAGRAAVMFSPTLAAVRTGKRVPYVGQISANPLLRQDGSTNTDGGVPYQAFIMSRPFTGGTLRRRKRIMEGYVLAKASTAVIDHALVRNFGEKVVAQSLALTATGSETRVRKFFDATDMADLIAVQIILGDSSPQDNAFELDQWIGADESEPGAR